MAGAMRTPIGAPIPAGARSPGNDHEGFFDGEGF
jgi:hypothetical protein